MRRHTWVLHLGLAARIRHPEQLLDFSVATLVLTLTGDGSAPAHREVRLLQSFLPLTFLRILDCLHTLGLGVAK